MSESQALGRTPVLFFNHSGGPCLVGIGTFVATDPSPHYPDTRVSISMTDGNREENFGLALTPRNARALAEKLVKAADLADDAMKAGRS